MKIANNNLDAGTEIACGRGRETIILQVMALRRNMPEKQVIFFVWP